MAIFLMLFNHTFPQKQLHKSLSFSSQDINAYSVHENKYDLWSYRDLSMFKGDSTSYYIDVTDYKGNINYGLKFSAYDKKVVNYIEDYNLYYFDVYFDNISFSTTDSIITIEGRVAGGWTLPDINWGKIPNLVEVSIGNIINNPFHYRFYPEIYGLDRLKITYKGEHKTTAVLLDTLPALIYKEYHFKKLITGTSQFKIRSKVDQNSVLSFGKYMCFAQFYNIGEMVFADQKKPRNKSAKPRSKDAPRFKRIIQKNVQVNNPANPVKRPDPLYYQLTEKAEGYILNKQYAKAKEQYNLLDTQYPTLFARDLNNAVRCAILSRDFKNAIFWSEKLTVKGVSLKYYTAKIFSKLKQNPVWKEFENKFPVLQASNQQKLDQNYIAKINALTAEDQLDYGLETRKSSEIMYETTARVTAKLIDLLKRNGLPTEEKVGLTIKNDTTIVISSDHDVLIRHAIQQEPPTLPELRRIIEADHEKLEFDFKRSPINNISFNSCYHIYKGDLYIERNCTPNAIAERKLAMKFKNPHGFILDYGNFVISEYNKESPQEYDDYYKNNYIFLTNLTSDWYFYEK